MRAYTAFLRKEFTEGLRTCKFPVMAAVFVLLGLMNPLIAKMLPDLFSGVDLGGGMILTMPEPTAMDSWTQFFSNMSQIGIVTLVVVFCGIMSNEFSRGTLVNILSKGMRRHTVLLAKFTAAAAVWTVCYAISLAVTWAYTAYFWQVEPMQGAAFAFASPWVYGLLLISLMMLGGMLFKTFYGSLLVTVGAVVAMSLVSIIPNSQRYNPIALSGDTLAILMGAKSPGDFMPAMVICAVGTVVLFVLSAVVFNKKEM